MGRAQAAGRAAVGQGDLDWYAAVLFLRRRGHRVEAFDERAGQHCLDGAILPTSWLCETARSYGWAPVRRTAMRSSPRAGRAVR